MGNNILISMMASLAVGMLLGLNTTIVVLVIIFLLASAAMMLFILRYITTNFIGIKKS